jgi:hypothetical protein
MAKSRGTEVRQMSRSVYVRLPKDLAVRLAAEAKGAGLTDAAMVRQVLTVTLVDADPADAEPVRRYRRRPGWRPPSRFFLEVSKLRESLAETCGALVKAAIYSREDGRAESHAEIEAALPTVRRLTIEIADLKSRILAADREDQGQDEDAEEGGA